jgi:DNA transformation protein and related proteins
MNFPSEDRGDSAAHPPPTGGRSIIELRNLGPRCAEWLGQMGVVDEDGLRSLGAAAVYRELVLRGIVRPHKMLLYALGGALLDCDCTRLPTHIKHQLVAEAGLEH